MTVHLVLACPEIKPGDEIEDMAIHQRLKTAPDGVDCKWCTDNWTIGHLRRNR